MNRSALGQRHRQFITHSRKAAARAIPCIGSSCPHHHRAIPGGPDILGAHARGCTSDKKSHNYKTGCSCMPAGISTHPPLRK